MRGGSHLRFFKSVTHCKINYLRRRTRTSVTRQELFSLYHSDYRKPDPAPPFPPRPSAALRPLDDDSIRCGWLATMDEAFASSMIGRSPPTTSKRIPELTRTPNG